MVTIAIMSIMVAIGFPSFQTMIASNRLTSSTNSMVSALQLARMEAVKQHEWVIIKPKDNVTDGWANGWYVFVDFNGDNAQDSLTEPTIATFDALNSTTTMTAVDDTSVVSTAGYSNRVSYRPSGRVNSSGHFTFCSAAAQDFRSVIIAATGRIRVETSSNSTTTYATSGCK